jgi:hypothetical protein
MCKKYERMIDIRPLKAYARRDLPGEWYLRELILSEEDWIPACELIGLNRAWMRLLDLENLKKRTR